jgi:tetratricopeptide (TPR) repeat protein
MKKIMLVLAISLAVVFAYAQSKEIDSLKQLLRNETVDSNRVLLLAELSNQLHESRPDTSMGLALEALAVSNKIGYLKGEATSLNRISNAFQVLGNYPKELDVLLQALKINERIHNLDGIERNWNNIGEVYFLEGDYRQALEYYFKAKSLAEEINNRKSICITLVNIGHCYYNLKVFDSAKQYTQQSYDIAYKIHYSRLIGSSLYILGSIHCETRLYPLALDYFRLSIDYLKEAKDDLTLSEMFLGMAKVFLNRNQNDSALYYSKQAMMLGQAKGFIKQILDASLFISHFFESRQKLDSAFIYQKLTIAANDSLFSQQKQRQLQGLSFDEKLRQQQITQTELKTKEERKRNLQYAAIALGLITFVILFLLLSHSIVANPKLIRFFGVVALLMVFEFINLYIHPYLSHVTNDSPFLMLLVMVCIASLLVPVHHWMENWITHQLVEKNKRIRLDAARKTIQQLEG